VKKAKFKFVPFSRKQLQVLTWWTENSPHRNKDAIICDGSVRSGKTLIMSLSYVIWAMENFTYCNFGMSGKTIGSFKRNVWLLLRLMLMMRGYKIRKVPDADSNNAYSISRRGTENYFFIFGGTDERSYTLVQGLTAAGWFFDEVALQPKSFVEQAIARCSVDDSKLWFNCNPDGPFHWFKLEWIDHCEEMNALHIHFLMDDNPSLSEEVKERYKRMFRGIFYDRYILGLWVVAEGIIYSMFRKEMVIDSVPAPVKITRKWIGIDYGQSNATVFLLCGLGSDNKLYILDEYYHQGKVDPIQKSPSKYSNDYMKWKIKNGVDGMPVKRECTFIDPSAKGFMLQLFEVGERQCRQADNEVLRGIELISSLIDNDMLRVLKQCDNTIKELAAYSWDPKAQEKGEDKPIKKYDHALDGLRYIVNGTRLLWQRLIAEKAKQESMEAENRLPVA
jgi:PBSX family phage terminase large subunit